MPCPDYGIIGENLTFTIQARDGTGAPVDTDAVPAYEVYEDETGTPIVTSTNMAKLDDAGTTGFYSEQIAITTAIGYELYKSYTIRVTAAVATISIAKAFTFICVGSTVVPTATSGALTTYANVKLYMGLSTDDDQTLIEALITRATSAIQNYTGRTLISTAFRERYDSVGDNEIILDEYPIISVNFVSVGVVDAFQVTNTSSDAYRAVVSVEDSTLTAPNMTLEVFGGANDGSNSLDLESLSAQTITGLVADINALGGGWAATAGTQPLYDPIEILPFTSSECLNNYAYGEIPDEPLWHYKVYYDRGILRLDNRVTKSNQSMIVRYTAGYATTPADLEQICIDLTKQYYDAASKDAAVKGEKLGDYAYTLADSGNGRMNVLNDAMKLRLSAYVKATKYAL